MKTFVSRFMFWYFALSLVFTSLATGQELISKVTINSLAVRQSNKSIFTTLEKAIQDFLNTTQWTGKTLKPHELIGCDLFITINTYENDKVSGTLKIQSSRPVYASNYTSTVFVYNDKTFNFNYNENEPLFFNPNAYTSNLVSLLSFYAYIVIGMDADTFVKKSGSEHYRVARDILNYTRTVANIDGWDQSSIGASRWNLIDNLISDTFGEFRDAMYNYHINGIDKMIENPLLAKTNIKNSILSLESMNARRANSLLLEVFFDSKANEFEQIFTGGPNFKTTDLVELLENLSPKYEQLWRNIK